MQRGCAQLRYSREPAGVEVRGRCGRATSGNPVWLLEQRDQQIQRVRRPRSSRQIGGADTPSRAVTEHQRRDGLIDGMQERSARAVRCFDIERHDEIGLRRRGQLCPRPG